MKTPTWTTKIGPYSNRMVTGAEPTLAGNSAEDVLALVEAALEQGCTFGQIGLELRTECALDAGGAIELTKASLLRLAFEGNALARQMYAGFYGGLPTQLQ